jgi:hypothetical protein
MTCGAISAGVFAPIGLQRHIDHAAHRGNLHNIAAIMSRTSSDSCPPQSSDGENGVAMNDE